MQYFNENNDGISNKTNVNNKRKTKDRHNNKPKYWVPGQELTEKDKEMLIPVKVFYEEKGYSPIRQDISTNSKLKSRFRIWKNVLIAADLPAANESENYKKRLEAITSEENQTK